MNWAYATWPSRSTTSRRPSKGWLRTDTGWSATSASTSTAGGWPTCAGQRGSSCLWPSGSADARVIARTKCVIPPRFGDADDRICLMTERFRARRARGAQLAGMTANPSGWVVREPCLGVGGDDLWLESLFDPVALTQEGEL